MSVINQMLKDLENRQVDNTSTSSPSVRSQPTGSPVKTIIIAIVVLLIINVVAIYMWQLMQENNQLKLTQNTKSTNALQIEPKISTSQILEKTTITNVRKGDSPLPAVTQLTADVATPPKSEPPKPTPETQPAIKSTAQTVMAPSIQVSSSTGQSIEVDQRSSPNSEILPSRTIKVSQPTITRQAGVKTAVSSTNQTEIFNNTDVVNVSNVQRAAEKPASLTISRQQLSPQALAKQKMQKAEQSLADNEIGKAEALFEEILLILPSHNIARQQLAALWYGRKSYQPALNLLQQGLVLTPDNSVFRMMKARIHLSTGATNKAYEVLSVLPNEQQLEYQALLANAAQQLGKHEAAIKAYSILTRLSPNNGRYWLGLAIAHDRSSEFPAAISAYQAALEQRDLSTNALDFVQQRLNALGE